jgi:hypothetical protein
MCFWRRRFWIFAEMPWEKKISLKNIELFTTVFHERMIFIFIFLDHLTLKLGSHINNHMNKIVKIILKGSSFP